MLSGYSLKASPGWPLPGPASLALVPLRPHRALKFAAGLRFSVAGHPGSDLKLFCRKRFNSLTARSGDGRPSGEEKECAAISQHLLPWVRVAVRAAKQDVG